MGESEHGRPPNGTFSFPTYVSLISESHLDAFRSGVRTLNQLMEQCISLLDALPSREYGPSLCYKDAYGEGLDLLPLSAVFILFRKWPSGERQSRRCHAQLS